MCCTCPCLLPGNGHSDRRNLTWDDMEARQWKPTPNELMAATETKVGDATVEKVRQNMARVKRLVNSGKLEKTKRSNKE